MAIFKRKLGINTSKFFIILILSFLTIQFLSFVLTEFGYTQMFKGGFMIFLFLISIFLVTLFSIGKNITQLKKQDLLIVISILGLLILAFIYLPRVIPQIFSSSSMQFKTSLEEIIQAIVKLSPGGIFPGN